MAKRHPGQFTSILDFMHATPKLWEVAHCFHPEGSEEAKVFVNERVTRLLTGNVDYVIRGIRQMATKHGLRGNKQKTIARVTGYYEKNRHRMKYDEYLAAGYPIGTGPAEGACCNLVKDRLEGTGMRWSIPGAPAMLHLRATFLNDDWDPHCQFRIQREQERLYPYQQTLEACRNWRGERVTPKSLPARIRRSDSSSSSARHTGNAIQSPSTIP